MYVLTPYSPQHSVLSSHYHQSDKVATEQKGMLLVQRGGILVQHRYREGRYWYKEVGYWYSTGTERDATGTKKGSYLYTHIWEGKTKCFLDIEPTASVKVWSCI